MSDETSKIDEVNEKTFSELIGKYEFFIPSYQRAYSWTEKQIELFIVDLAEHAANGSQYYLGHYILEIDPNGKMAIVDGQQRITTVAIFLAVCQHLQKSTELLIPLHLDVVTYDNDRFKEILEPATIIKLKDQEEGKEATASLERVVKAIQTFFMSFGLEENKKSRALLSIEHICAYIDVIRKAAVSIGVYQSKGVASQIFELHNTRGVQLSETEKVKALLMKYVYLNSLKGKSDENVIKIQDSFAKVFKCEEEAAKHSFRGEMSLDDLLAHHLRAIDEGSEEKNQFTQPQSVDGDNGCVAHVRKRLSGFEADKERGIAYAKSLAEEFAESMRLVSTTFVKQDEKEPLIGDVILLDQRRSMIFLFRYLRKLPDGVMVDRKLLQRWESLLALWDCHDSLHGKNHSSRDGFPEIFQKIFSSKYCQTKELINSYYEGTKPFNRFCFVGGLANIFQNYIDRKTPQLLHYAYGWGHWHGRFKYWLYKYEIETQIFTGQDQAEARKSLRSIFRDNKVTMDHIVPHELEWKELSINGEKDNERSKWKDPDDIKQAEENWEKIENTINGFGNLVLLGSSENARLQNIPPYERAEKYKEWGLKSISYQEVAEWKDPGDWATKIEYRGKSIIDWVKTYFTDKCTWTDPEPKVE